MRILLISRCPPYPLHWGDRLIIWHLLRELTQRGCTFDLVAFAQHASDWQETEQYQHLFEQVTLVEEPSRSRWDYLRRLLRLDQRFPDRADDAWSAEMWRAIQVQLKQQEYDLVHFFGGIQVYEYYQAVAPLPAVITPYESYSLYLKRQIAQNGGWLNRINQQVAQAFERWMFNLFDATVVVAPPDRDELKQRNPTLPVHVIANGIDLQTFTPQPDVERHPAKLLFVGNYTYPPNVDAAHILIERILPEVQTLYPAAQLWLVGSDPPDELQARASETVHITGRVSDVRPYLAQATAFVCPLRIGAGIKNKVLEALAMGTPVIATPLSVDGIDVHHNETALITEIDAMPAAVMRLLTDVDLQRALSKRGAALIQSRYSWARAAEQYLRLYREIV